MKSYAVVSKHLLLPFVKTHPSTPRQRHKNTSDPQQQLPSYSEWVYFRACLKTAGSSQVDGNHRGGQKQFSTTLTTGLEHGFLLLCRCQVMSDSLPPHGL